VPYIIECSTCSQAWSVPTFVLSTRNVWIQVPEHDALTDSGAATSVPCVGVWSSGISLGLQEDWEDAWSLRHPGRPRPRVLEGDEVKLMRV
jgi:hypothetical protein